MADAARDAMAVRRVQIDTPYVHLNGANNDPELDVTQPLYVGIRLDGKGAYPKGARGWDHTKLGTAPDPSLFFLQTMLLLVESTSEGSVRPNINWESSPAEYKALVETGAKIKKGDASVDQRQSFARNTTCDRNVDLRFLHDIDNVYRRLLFFQEYKRRNGKLAKKSKKNTADNREPFVLVPRPKQTPHIVCASWARASDIVCRPRSRVAVDVEPVDMDAMHRAAVSVLDQDIYAQRLAAYNANAVATLEPAMEDDELEAIPGMPPLVPYSGGVSGNIPKIQVTVTPVPITDGDVRNAEQVGGLMVAFLIRDPAINAGNFFLKLVKNNLAREGMKQGGGGGGKSRHGGGHEEMFPGYVSMLNSSHPVGNKTTNQVYFQAAYHYARAVRENYPLESDKRQLYNSMNIAHFNNPFHLNRILSVQNAQIILSEAGCNPEFCARTDTWFNVATREARFHADLVTYKYVSDGVFWYNPVYVGFREQNFPHISSDGGFLARLASGVDPAALLDENSVSMLPNGIRAEDVSSAMEERRRIIAESFRVSRRDLENKQTISYRTNNPFIYGYADSLVIEAQVIRYKPEHMRDTFDAIQEYRARHGKDWRLSLPVDLLLKVEECDQYTAIRNQAQEACMHTFQGLWLLDGNIDDAPIPDSLKVIQKFYRDNQRKSFPHLSREYIMYDPKMGMFGNAMLRLVTMYSCVAKIVHPIVCILAIGLFSCYSQKRELKFNMLGHGWHATGKSKTAIDTFKDYTSIPHSSVLYSTATAAADNTSRHVYDTILLSDEVQPWKVDPEEAKKHATLVNIAKVKMTANQVGHNIFKNVTLEDGTVVRWNELITTDHFITVVEVTNSEVSAKDALASRYFRFTMPMPKIPVHELGGQMDGRLSDETTTFMRISQYLMCCAMKCATMGGMLPEPEKELWSSLSGRVIDFLIKKKAITREEGTRGLDIMWPLVRQFIYLWAQICAFDMPGAPNYYKKFDDVSMIREMQPYLYCTVEIFYWGWSSLGTAWVEDNNSKFIDAIESISGYTAIKKRMHADPHRVIQSETNYNIFEYDVESKLAWQVTDAAEVTQELKAAGNHRNININYLVFKGNRHQVAQRIANASDGLSPTDVLGLLNTLSHHSIKVPGGAIAPQPMAAFKHWHKCTGRVGSPFNKNTDPDDTGAIPAYYRVRNPNTSQFRTEFDVSRLSEEYSMPIVDLSNDKKEIYIMPGVADLFKSSIIDKALIYATMSSTFPEGKILLGTPCETSSTQLRSLSFTQDMIDQCVERGNAAMGWKMDNHGVEQWCGNPNIPEEHRPLSMSKGIAFNRRVGISKSNGVIFNACPTVPLALGDESWREKATASLKSMEDVVTVVRDINEEAATRQHLLCGRGFDLPVLTPRFIEQRYKESCAKLNRNVHADKDYPHDWELDALENEARWEAARPTEASTDWADTIHREAQPLAANARNPATRAALQAHKRRKQNIDDYVRVPVVAQEEPEQTPPASYGPITRVRIAPPAQRRTRGEQFAEEGGEE